MTYKEIAQQAMKEMAQEIEAVSKNISGDFDKIVEEILNTKGRLVISGMGKSGIIGKKMVATLTSTGTPSFFLHPSEAYHGDLGIISDGGVIILISYSGETEEVLKIIPSLKRFNNKIIAICGNENSTLVNNSDYFISMKVSKEVCPNNLAPTTSTMANLAVGDALAVALIHARDFKPHDFAQFHPGGSLGRKLLTKVGDVMTQKLPILTEEMSFTDSLIEITSGKLGLGIVIDPESQKIIGIVTDGDIRRKLTNMSKEDKVKLVNGEIRVKDFMTKTPHTITPQERIEVAENYMIKNKIKALIVKNEENEPIGVVQIYD